MPDDTTTEAPAGPPPPAATTAAPAPASNTTQAPAPANNTTAAPAPGNDTTAAPATNTTTGPGGQTTQAPGITTTQPPGQSTTAGGPGPHVDASIAIDPPDSTNQNQHSYQVANSAKLTLTWSATNATSVNITGVGDGQGLTGSVEIPTSDGRVSLVAVAADGTLSPSFDIDISTHEDGQVVSPHSDLSSGAAVILSFSASKDGQTVTTANIGDEVTLTAVVSESTDSCTISGAPVSLSDSGGNKTGSTTVTIAAPMSGDFDCQVSASGTAGSPGSLHLDLGAAASPSASTTVAPGFTTTQGSSPGNSTTQSPGNSTTQSPGNSTTAPVCVASTTQAPGSSTTQGPGSSTTQAPGSTTTAPAIPSTTTIPTAPITTTSAAAATITIYNGTVNPSFQPVDTDHFGVSMGLTFTGTLTWSGSSTPPGQAATLPDEWNTKLSDHINLHLGLPVVQAWVAGASPVWKSYASFWDRFKPRDEGIDAKIGKDGKKWGAEGKCSVNVGSVDLGELDLVAKDASGGLGMPAVTITLTVAVANVDAVKLWKSAIGVIQGVGSVQLGTIDISDNDVGGGTLKLSGTLSAQVQLTGKGITVEELAKDLAEGAPEVVAAVAAVLCVVGAVYVAVETPSYDEVMAMGPQVKTVCDKAVADYIAGVRGNSSGNAQGAAGAQQRQISIDKMKQDNPSVTDDQITAAIEQQIPSLTTQLTSIYMPKCQDQAWNNWAASRQGTRTLATTHNMAVLAWQSIYPGTPYENDSRFTRYFELSDVEKQDADANKMNDTQRLAAWKAWVANNTHWYGDAGRAEAQGNYCSIMKKNDYEQDPDYQAHWGR